MTLSRRRATVARHSLLLVTLSCFLSLAPFLVACSPSSPSSVPPRPAVDSWASSSIPPSSPPVDAAPEGLPADFVPPIPVLPRRFRAKLRFLIGPAPGSGGVRGSSGAASVFEEAAHRLSTRPSLSLVHFDASGGGRIREDLYALRRGGVHRRFFTSVRHFRSRREWLIYHKQPRSPRACLQVPWSGAASALLSSPGSPKLRAGDFANLERWGEQLEFQGLATMSMLAADAEQGGGGAQNVTLLHYRSRSAEEVPRDPRFDRLRRDSSRAASYGGRPMRPTLLSSAAPPLHVYLHPLTHQPLLLLTPHARIDVLAFQAITDEKAVEQLDAVFDPQRASKAKCIQFADQTPQQQEEERQQRETDAAKAQQRKQWFKDEL